jgi:NAD(P)H-nitrite reductase large subunit
MTTMGKTRALEVFSELDDANVRASVRRAQGDVYEVVVAAGSLTGPATLRTLADVIEKYDLRMAPVLDELRLR